MAQENVIWALACACFLCLPLLPSASGWSNGGYSSDYENPDYGTHDWIADKAVGLQTRDVKFLSETYHSRFLLGTEAPDNPDLIGDTVKHHVYYYSTGILQEDDAADRAAQLYGSALEDLKASNYSAAAYHIGIMSHYISDAGAFGHTMGNKTDWGTEVHHSDYEDGVNSLVSSYSPVIDRPLGQMDAYNSSLGLAREITFGNGTVRSNIWMDQNYDWANGDFVESAKASLIACVMATASAINSLMTAVNAEPPTIRITTTQKQTLGRS
jgi:hypothetical protein